MKNNYSLVLFFFLFLVSGCRKKALPTPANPTVNPPAVVSGNIRVQLSNFVGNRPLLLGDSVTYTLENGDDFSVSTYNYYLSNFVFIDEKGNRFKETESYHLAMANMPESLSFTIKDVPFGNYKSVEFLIGVDSVRNFSGAQIGALDPKYGMIWTWSTGYIMAKMEGNSPQSSNPNKSLSYHIAGFKGLYNVLQTVKLNLDKNALVAAGKTPVIKMKSDLAFWFQAPNFTSFSLIPEIGIEGIRAYNISQNYAAMMSISSVDNQ
jgi:hypothetical protein